MSLPTENTQVLLAKRPVGMIKPDEDFKIVKTPLPQPTEGQVLVRSIYLSLDPAMRGWMSDRRSYAPPVPLDSVMRGYVIGEVVESKSPKFQPGDLASGLIGWQEYAALDADTLNRIPPLSGSSLAEAFTILSITGMTAYFGLFEVGKPKAGDTVVVSGAAGATGGLVVQLAKLHGCRVVGIAGGPDKCRHLKETFGVDEALDYRLPSFKEDLAKATPDYINVYFDNVGGDILDAVLGRLALNARIAVCGAISQYNSTDPRGPANYINLIAQRATMQGFIVSDYHAQFGKAAVDLMQWYGEGKIKVPVDIQPDGVQVAPHALLKLFDGSNKGKLLVKVGHEPSESA
ncbi:putative zinc-containing alcohol dehydrogenase [Thamnocephalis sphaerospora]|uniref:Putative zinc-containing alcohol dehydrogenase n=1 Tax=Thamnocephalis sphaerospora TaxID=78915 RepID=A0A4P9XNK7_9FUNG|nr:putative zinc-containing alcohol dehydrogenase [Thamnocephalis sphaerospora]|eukprot:RKP07525.1 putative zinc-containing alcohol dehydrogenase [Thamnocephalis sphaerospora]